MTHTTAHIESLLETPDLAQALESHQFKQFLDNLPVAIAVAELIPTERIIYANVEFERITGIALADILAASWDAMPGEALDQPGAAALGPALAQSRDYLGAFAIPADEGATHVDAWSNLIEDDAGLPVFRLVVLAETHPGDPSDRTAIETRVEEKDLQLRELQHRVKNNLQMITALIRVEARGLSSDDTGDRFDRLAGRVEALGLLYALLTETVGEEIDLGVYLSQIAAAVIRAHAVEGIHLDLQVDTWPVALDTAMPAGLVVNELLTNALKHAFVGRPGGTITLHCLNEQDGGCRVLIADDGIGLPKGGTWPAPGKLSTLIVKSLVQNARAAIDVKSTPGEGMQVTITFTRRDAVRT
jgi:two-component sensor histidine kinase